MEERVWLRRLHWRLRGAWQWPAFAALTLGDAVLIHLLPVGGSGTGFVAALLLAMFFNLVAVVAGGPLVALVVRRRRPDLPKVIVADRAGVVALVVTTVILAGFGISHHRTITRERADFTAQSRAMVAYVAGQPAEYRRNLARADAIKFGERLYRTCVPGNDPRRALCVFIDVSRSPPVVREDPSRAPNATFVPFSES